MMDVRTNSAIGGVSASSTPITKSFAPPRKNTKLTVPATRARKPANIIGHQRFALSTAVATISIASVVVAFGEKIGFSAEHPHKQVAVVPEPMITFNLFQNNIRYTLTEP
jgi:hypothetical protein